MQATMTLIGLESFMAGNGLSIFDSINLPTGVKKDTLTNAILMRAGEFESLYTDPVFLSSMIGIWSTKWYSTFDKWIKALDQEYNPIENYDRKEDSTRKNTGTVSSEGSTTNKDKVSGFNSSTMVDNSESNLSNENEVTNDLTETFTNRIHGNIGVTTSQQMLQSEMELRRNYNIYEIITDMFVREFCIMVY